MPNGVAKSSTNRAQSRDSDEPRWQTQRLRGPVKEGPESSVDGWLRSEERARLGAETISSVLARKTSDPRWLPHSHDAPGGLRTFAGQAEGQPHCTESFPG